MENEKDKYWLATNSHASARLNLQHFWNQLSCGYLIHPDIAFNGSARIADIGTEKWNIHESVPEYLLGQYDVVNIRYFALVVRKDNLSRLLRNLISLLKPGGYLQWIEINIAEQQIVSARPDTSMAATSSFSEDGKKAIATLGVRFDWLNDLPSIYQEFGLVEASQFKPDPIPALRPMSSYLAIGGWEEFSYNVLDKKGAHPLLGSGQDLRRRLNDVRNETQTGAAIEQLH
ncbi:hypothetical protein EYZ11_005276 [Aspergillus tanneri]|uniref:Methyltransferase type 11 domain-containing protein n=1 Tax=Aspergillus tanneri TaxID=1220188 RepID=A0A4S3JKP9_9EURO|nr:hypothetical protein EYZ11_005276 [Aspergillus tanneri]